MHKCRKLRGVKIRFITALGEADAVLNSVAGVPLAGEDCWTGEIVPLLPNSTEQRLTITMDGDMCAARLHPAYHGTHHWCVAAKLCAGKFPGGAPGQGHPVELPSVQ